MPDTEGPATSALVPLPPRIQALERRDRDLQRARRRWWTGLLLVAMAAVALPTPLLQGGALVLGLAVFLGMRAALRPHRAARRSAYEELRRAYALASRAEDHGRTSLGPETEVLERARLALGPGTPEDG